MKLTTVIMKRLSILFTSLLLCVGTAMAAVNIIPKPTSLVEKEGEFVFTKGFTIGYNDASLMRRASASRQNLAKARSSSALSFPTKTTRAMSLSATRKAFSSRPTAIVASSMASRR